MQRSHQLLAFLLVNKNQPNLKSASVFSINIKMSLIRIKLISNPIKLPRYSFSTLINEEEYTATPNYPPIKDLSRKGYKKIEQNDIVDYIKNIKTVEEKLIKFNMPKYYGFKTYLMSNRTFPYNSLPFIQYITKSVYLDGLPKMYDEFKEQSASLAQKIKSQVIDVLLFEHEFKRWKYDHTKHNLSRVELDDIFAQSIIEQINRIIIINLNSERNHLLEAQVDVQPKIESFWIVGGFEPPLDVFRAKMKSQYKDEANDPYDRYFQYVDSIALNLRHELPLPVFAEPQDLDLSSLEVPKFTYDPRVNTYFIKRRHLTTIPGFWPGDENEFSFLSFNTCGYLKERNPKYGDSDILETLKSQALISSFAYLMAQCSHQGFSTYNELTYPQTTQTVITDGRLWSLFAYQMNTTLLYSEHCNSEKKNICWGEPQMPLFENFSEGKIIGFNEKTLERLISFYLLAPRQRLGVELRPYLGVEQKRVADIEDEERRQWLDKMYKFFPIGKRVELTPEIYLWEKIYKIDNKTRPMEAKRRHFELGINPWQRTLDDYEPKYIPKCLRKPGREREKYERKYFP